MAEQLGGEIVTLYGDNIVEQIIQLNKDEEAAAYWTYLNDKESGTGTNTFYGAKGYYIPLKNHEKILGVLGISCSYLFFLLDLEIIQYLIH